MTNMTPKLARREENEEITAHMAPPIPKVPLTIEKAVSRSSGNDIAAMHTVQKINISSVLDTAL